MYITFFRCLNCEEDSRNSVDPVFREPLKEESIEQKKYSYTLACSKSSKILNILRKKTSLLCKDNILGDLDVILNHKSHF